MSDPKYDTLSLTLTPEVDQSGNATAISFSFDIESLNLDVSQALVWMNTKRASVQYLLKDMMEMHSKPTMTLAHYLSR
jgi:hypothetical protein